MTSEYYSPLIKDSQYRRRLAGNLVGSLGIENALELCYENRWGSIIEIILKDRRYSPWIPTFDDAVKSGIIEVRS